MEEKRPPEEIIQELKKQFLNEVPAAPVEEMSNQQLNAFLEAIAIIFEKCTTKEECIDALHRIQTELTKGD